jgi:hypothetical protein
MIEAAVKLQAAWRGILRNRKLKQLRTSGQHEGLQTTEESAIARDVGGGGGGGSSVGVGVGERLASVEHGSRGDKPRSATTIHGTPRGTQSQLTRTHARERENATTETLSRSHVEGCVIQQAHVTHSRVFCLLGVAAASSRRNPTRRSSALNLHPFSCKVLCTVDGALQPIFAPHVTAPLSCKDMTSWIRCRRPARELSNPNEG